jgi:hypothetical protein
MPGTVPRLVLALAILLASLLSSCGGSMTYSVKADGGAIRSEVIDSRSDAHTVLVVLPETPAALEPPDETPYPLLTAHTAGEGEVRNHSTVPVPSGSYAYQVYDCRGDVEDVAALTPGDLIASGTVSVP